MLISEKQHLKKITIITLIMGEPMIQFFEKKIKRFILAFSQQY